MRVIEGKELRRRFAKRRRLVRRRLLALLLILVLILGIVFTVQAYSRPLPSLLPEAKVLTVPGHSVALTWPDDGQAAIGAVGYGVLASSGAEQAAPMASVAKVMTALAVLHQHPLANGQQGPTLTLTAADVDLYNSYQAQDGSVVLVSDGEQISEYQALEAMLLPSANNMADTLATWAFGSMGAYLNYANNLAASLQLNQTHLADASGFSPQTVSTAANLVLLGQAALHDSVLTQIVGQSQADVPVAGTVHNVNYLLGQDGIIGIKTGNTDEAGGCFLFAAKHTFSGGQTVTMVGAVMGMPSLGTAMASAPPLLNGSYQGLGTIEVAKSNQTIGQYNLPWGGNITAVAEQQLSVFGWLGDALKPTVKLQAIQPAQLPNHKIGSLSVQTPNGTTSVPIVLRHTPPSPSWRWRLFR